MCEHSDLQDLIETCADWSGQLNENLSFGTSRTARDIVLQLCIDDGVPDRGHRGVIFSRRMRFAGVAVGDHRKWGNMCCIHYAEYCKPKKGATGRELPGSATGQPKEHQPGAPGALSVTATAMNEQVRQVLGSVPFDSIRAQVEEAFASRPPHEVTLEFVPGSIVLRNKSARGVATVQGTWG